MVKDVKKFDDGESEKEDEGEDSHIVEDEFVLEVSKEEADVVKALKELW